MPRTRTPLQQELIADVWRLSELRTALQRQLADVEDQQRKAITIAAMNGVRQNLLAEISGLTEPRVSKVVNQTALSSMSIEDLRTVWAHMAEYPAEHLTRSKQHVTQDAVDRWNRRHELVHGEPGGLVLGAAPDGGS